MKGSLLFWCDNNGTTVSWLFAESEVKKINNFHDIKDGDELTVFAENGDVLFNGMIDCDYSRAGEEVMGYIIKWLQKDFPADKWASMFIRKKGEKTLQAELKLRVMH
jgi:hypothetical protein